MFDFQSLVKYLLEGLAVAVAAFYIPRKTVDIKEVALIALTAAAVFAVLDQFAPAVGVSTRQGAGFGIGLQQVGFGYPEGFEGMEQPESFEQEDYSAGSRAGFTDGSNGTELTGVSEGYASGQTAGQDLETETFEGEMVSEGFAETEVPAEVPAEGYDDYTETFEDKERPQEYPSLCNDKCEYTDHSTKHQRDRMVCQKKDGKCMVVKACKLVDDECRLNPSLTGNKEVSGKHCVKKGKTCHLEPLDKKEKFSDTEGFEDYETFEDQIQGFEGFTKTF